MAIKYIAVLIILLLPACVNKRMVKIECDIKDINHEIKILQATNNDLQNQVNQLKIDISKKQDKKFGVLQKLNKG